MNRFPMLTTFRAAAASLALVLALVVPAIAAADTASKVDAILTEAQSVEREATELASHLKRKDVSESVIRDKMEPLEKHVGTLHELVGSLEGERSSMTASQVAALDRVKLKSELLHVFTNNKKNMLEGDWRKNRSMLRAKAEGIAKRAQALRQSARGLKDS